jgi:hypothetical protein
MAQASPTIEAFRAVFRQPSVALAEISWRWTFWATGCGLLLLAVFEYLNSVPVAAGDALFLKTRHPLLVSRALSHILAGSGTRLMKAGILLALALGALWIFVSSMGRAATIRPLLEYFHHAQRTPADLADDAPHLLPRSWLQLFCSLMGLGFLRLTLVLAGLLAMVSSGVLAGFFSTPTDPQPGLAFLIFLPLVLLIALSWSSMNWFLSIASIFVVRDGSEVFAAVASTVSFCLRRSGPISWSSTVFAICHFVVFVIASSVVVFPLAFVGLLPGWIVASTVAVLTLLYFAITDFFYVGRLAAYVCILESPEEPVRGAASMFIQPQVSAFHPAIPASASAPSLSQTSDAWPSDDDILSDVPPPPTEPPSRAE